jgi:hypothetical protein
MYYVMIDDEQSAAECASLAEARETGRRLLNAEPLPACFSIQNAEGEHVEDIGATIGRYTGALRLASRVLP